MREFQEKIRTVHTVPGCEDWNRTLMMGTTPCVTHHPVVVVGVCCVHPWSLSVANVHWTEDTLTTIHLRGSRFVFVS